MTGMYPTTLGTMHHRSNVGKPPAFLEMVPNQMRKAGYFTSTVHHGKLPVGKDGVHFNHAGQIELGKMTADAVEEFFKSKGQ